MITSVFTKDRATSNTKGDIEDDEKQYPHDNNISSKKDMGFSQMPIDDLFMPIQEPTESPLPTTLDNTSKTSIHQKRKGHAKNTTMEKIYENFLNFIEILGSVLKMFIEFAMHNAKSASHKC